MKLKDVIKAVGKRLDWIDFHWDWKVGDDGKIIPTLPVDITLDSEAYVHYQWFHHINPNINQKEIWNAIKNHDLDTFTKWYKELLLEQFVYLPSEAAIWVGDEHVGDVCIAYSKAVFDLIVDQDCECG